MLSRLLWGGGILLLALVSGSSGAATTRDIPLKILLKREESVFFYSTAHYSLFVVANRSSMKKLLVPVSQGDRARVGRINLRRYVVVGAFADYHVGRAGDSLCRWNLTIQRAHV